MPLSIKALKSQRALNEIAPKIEELKQKHKDNPSAQSAAIMQLYKDNKVNPFAGCLPLLIQLPIIIALYRAFSTGISAQNLNIIYDFITKPEVINQTFLGFINITMKNPFMAIIAGGLQFIQSKQMMANTAKQPTAPGGKQIANLNSQMLYFFPIFIIIIGWNLPSGLILYWITTTAFSIFEQMYIKRKHS